MSQDGEGEQTSLINFSVMASYETKGGGCYREVTFGEYGCNATSLCLQK